MKFPPLDATYSEIQAWEAVGQLINPVRCAACQKRCEKDAQPLTVRTRIRCSAKFKGRVFEPGQVLCSSHQTEAVL